MACESLEDLVASLNVRLAAAEETLAADGMGGGRNRAVKRLRKDLKKASKELRRCEARTTPGGGGPDLGDVLDAAGGVVDAVLDNDEPVYTEPTTYDDDTPPPSVPWVPIGLGAAALATVYTIMRS